MHAQSAFYVPSHVLSSMPLDFTLPFKNSWSFKNSFLKHDKKSFIVLKRNLTKIGKKLIFKLIFYRNFEERD